MKKLLRSSGEMLSNGLAMVTDFTSILASLQLGGFSSRRLLFEEEGRILNNGDPTDYAPGEDPTGFGEVPNFVDAHARKLMAATPATLKPNAVVAQDGSGQFKTISAAINTLPKKSNQTFVIYVKAGVYKETVMIPRNVNNVVLIGDGPLKTRITGNKNYAGGVQTFHTAVLGESQYQTSSVLLI